MSIFIFIVILLVLVLAHEFGHFFTAKRFGIRVDEFGFGFPPKLFGIKKGETEYTFNLLPIGGFVKIFGEDPNEENTHGPDANRSFVSKPHWQQALVLFAGIFSNFLLAWLLLSIGFMSGLPSSVGEDQDYEIKDAHTVIISVSPESPAFNAGLKSGDKIFSISNKDFSPSSNSPETVVDLVAESKGKEIEIGYVSNGKDFTSENVSYVKITPVTNGDEKPVIGISMDQIGTVQLPPHQALYEGMKLTLHLSKSTAVGLYTLISDGIMGKGSFNSVTGPVGMVGIVGDAYQFGFVYLLSFAALISINLAIINLIPFPALDGGRLFFLLIEKIKGSPLNPKVSNTANMVGFIVLILLMLIVTYHDVIKLF